MISLKKSHRIRCLRKCLLLKEGKSPLWKFWKAGRIWKRMENFLFLFPLQFFFWGTQMFAMKFRDDGSWFGLNVGAEQGDSSVAAQWTMGIWPIGHPVHRMYFVHYTVLGKLDKQSKQQLFSRGMPWVQWPWHIFTPLSCELLSESPVYQGKNIFPHYNLSYFPLHPSLFLFCSIFFFVLSLSLLLFTIFSGYHSISGWRHFRKLPSRSNPVLQTEF